MGGPNLDDYLTKGMYGEKQIKADERRKFLGTIRERVVVVLTNEQIYEDKLSKQIGDYMKSNPKAKLLLNGAINYDFLRKYIQLADKHHIPFTIVNKDTETNIGLVLTYDYAIDKENIYLKDEDDLLETEQTPKSTNEETGGLKSFLKKLLR
ncbi:YueI family protein [Bacillus kwashiorkori]|uniref:YueI family protein n=1 Tax=Bacillus kwashiorkori TaxID=1522318 RepID=UPI000783AC31|nr:YueI family protein [Bacillus kwashiorkori]